MKQELRATSRLSSLPNELLYIIFDHVGTSDLLSLARISRKLNAVAMRQYLGSQQEIQKNYSVFGRHSTTALRGFFHIRFLRLSLANPYLPSMTLIFSLEFTTQLDEVLRYHKNIPQKYYPSLNIDFSSHIFEQYNRCCCAYCGAYAKRLNTFCGELVSLRCISFKCPARHQDYLDEPASEKEAMFNPPPFTTLTSMYIPCGPLYIIDWLVRSAHASPLESLTLRLITHLGKEMNHVLALRLPHLKRITFDSCSFTAEKLSLLLSCHASITDLIFSGGNIIPPRSHLHTVRMSLPYLHTIVMSVHNLETILPSIRPRSFPNLKSIIMLGCECTRCNGFRSACEKSTKPDLHRLLYWLSRLSAVFCVELPFEYEWETITRLTLPGVTKLVSKRYSVASNLERITTLSALFPNVNEFEVVEIGTENNGKLMEEINERWPGLRCVIFSSRLSYTWE
ncbi:hypothetical protein ARMGADRAFT_1079016 [Armillaria gallica]|uniref:F-box domain-containing protein n=1 Tax=Armillaria gallica TaxID=47427 RepID=A0A2H3DZ05_ARMGA|nr:hypothetical protein ARMGADRAFT_1079016 [Armillaria gallica]